MTHQEYVLAAYAVAFATMTAISVTIWFRGRAYRRQVEVVAKIRHRAAPHADGR
ncbi:heme exporter protein CcmD [Rhizobium sp. GCM10022189]|uniref:heme exporter protein CcmD n=1 Tax=Rhizobium sp. GCM10022189 TaxID=3252654 RepID=UPI00360AFB2C